jgi:hypothetical protein
VVYGGHLTVVPGDRHRIPTRCNDGAAISGIAAPAYPVALYEFLRFGCGHVGLHRLGDGLAQKMWGAGVGFAKRRGRFQASDLQGGERREERGRAAREGLVMDASVAPAWIRQISERDRSLVAVVVRSHAALIAVSCRTVEGDG